MNQQTEDNRSIIRYLLNELSGQEKTDFEQKYFADYDLFERMRAVEEELIEDYVWGKLNKAERQQFERYYLATPGRREKVYMTRAMTEAVSPEALSQAAGDNAQPGHSKWRKLSLPLQRPRDIIVGLSMAAALLLLAVSLWLTFEVSRLRNRLEQSEKARAEVEQLETGLRQQLAEQRGRGDEPAKELDGERQQPQLPEAEQSKPGRTGFKTSTFVLAAGLVRDSARANEVVIDALTSAVRFKVEPAEDDFDSYDAQLRTVSDGKVVWRWQSLKPGPLESGRSITMSMPAGHLTASGRKDYILVLSGKTAAGQPEELEQYYLRVLKK